MKKLLRNFCAGVFFIATLQSNAQVSAYAFSQSTNTYNLITGGTILGTGTAVDDNNYNAIPIGFNFIYNGVSYANISVNANGFVAFGNTVTSSYTALSSGTSNNVFAAFNRDLQGNAAGELRYELTGTAPNRVFVIQWKAFRCWNTTGDSYDFQIRLNETSNVLQVMYGAITQNATTRTIQVGLRGTSNADFNNRTTTTDWSATTAGAANTNTCTLTTAIKPASGLTFSWTPPSCIAPGTLSASNVTGSTADLNWVPLGSETLWDVYYGPAPLAAPNGSTTPTQAGVTSFPHGITGLSPLTSYTFYVRADCGGTTSGWAGPYTFLSGCAGTGCNYTFNLGDSFGDGWNGNTISVVVGGVTVATVGTGFTAGSTFTQNVTICEGQTLDLIWNTGSFATECSVTVLDPFSNTITSFPTGGAPANGTTFFSGTGNCTAPAIDMQALNLASPAPGCYTNNESVDVTIKNNGGSTIDFSVDPVDVNVSVTGPNPQTFTTVTINSGTLAAGATQVVPIATGYDMSVAGTYAFSASTTVAADAFTANDAMPVQNRTTLAPPTALPLVQDFNAGTALPAGFTGTMYVLANHGTLASNGLTYNLYGGATSAAITLPYLGVMPSASTMEFDYRIVNYSGYPNTATTLAVGDSINLRISTDCGNTFTLLHSINSTNHTPGTAFVRPLINLTPYAGQNIILRWNLTYSGSGDYYVDIDNINIKQLQNDDAGVSLLNAPTSGCGLTANESITVTISNYGINALVNPDVSYSLNGAPAVTETTTLNIPSGASATYTFTTTEDLSLPGAYNFVAYTSLGGDGDLTNDTTYSTINAITTITPPFFSDFEADDAGLVAGGSGAAWQWGTPSNLFINSANGCGQNAWVTGLGSNYNSNANSTLTTACFDFTGSATVPLIRFDNIYQTETGYDRFWIEYSTNGGTTWTKLLPNTGNTGWYNNTTNNYWEGNSVNNTWMTSSNPLNGLEGTTAMFRVRFTSDGSVNYEGVGIDNLFIGYDFEDVKAIALTTPTSGCGLTATEVVTAQVVNSSTSTLSSVDICYTLNGGAPICETVTGTFNPGDTITHPFTVTVDLSATGAYTFQVVGSSASDNLICDTITKIINHIPTISTYPYFENFENGTAGWSSGGNNPWAFGTPAKTNINSAASGNNAWVTGGLTGTYINNENSYVESPCFDVTTLPTNPWVAVKLNWWSEFSWDGAALQMTKDNGATWTTVGAFTGATTNFPYYWYNDNSINGGPGGQQLGWTGTNANSSGGWKVASHKIDTTGFSLISTIRFRIAFGSDGSGTYEGIAFDDFAIGTLPQVNVGNDTLACGPIAFTSVIDSNATYTWIVNDTSSNSSTIAGNGYSFTFNNPAINDSVANVVLGYRDTLGFFNTDTLLATSYLQPQINLGVDTAICWNDTLVLQAGSNAGFSYQWNDASTLDSLLVTLNGLYAVTATVNATGCSASDSIMVYITPAVNLPASGAICSGNPLSIDAGAAYNSYMWSTTETTQAIVVNVPGTYNVSVSDSIGCMSSDSIVVGVGTTPTLDLGPDIIICNTVSTALNAGSGFTSYMWSDGTTLQTTIVDGSVLGNGTYNYYCVVTNSDGCSNSDTVTVVVDPCAGIDEITSASFNLFPNPNNGTFSITFTGFDNDINLEVFTIDGKQIIQKNMRVVSGEIYAMSINNQVPGIYILKVSDNNTSAYHRFIIK